MSVQDPQVRYGRVGSLNLEAYPTTMAMGQAAATAAAKEMLRLGRAGETVSVIFATGASQLATLEALTKMPGLSWGQISGYHLDEYVGLPMSHPASFRGYLRKHLTEKTGMKEFFEIDGTAPDPQAVCAEYAARLQAADPQLCLLGIGENGHLAFNDPGVADFHDPLSVKLALLDVMCRTQQAAEGWFPTLEDVPERAITVTIPAILTGAGADSFRARKNVRQRFSVAPSKSRSVPRVPRRFCAGTQTLRSTWMRNRRRKLDDYLTAE